MGSVEMTDAVDPYRYTPCVCTDVLFHTIDALAEVCAQNDALLHNEERRRLLLRPEGHLREPRTRLQTHLHQSGNGTWFIRTNQVMAYTKHTSSNEAMAHES